MKSNLHFKILTLFPEMFPGTLGFSLAGKALDKGLWSYEPINIRDYGIGKHKQVDDYPYGGGHGLVIKPDVIGNAIRFNATTSHMPIYYMSPRGDPINNDIVDNIVNQSEVTIICGRYEGIDQRVIDEYNIKEVCVGDVVLSGGEPAAILMMDAIIRKIPGVLHNSNTLVEESFSKIFGEEELLEYPLYTKPQKWNKRAVPQILLSGNHAKIKEWKRSMSLDLTQKRRSDMLKGNI